MIPAAGADPLRFEFVDTLMNACTPDMLGSADTVPISAEDLSSLISSAQPYTAMDAPAMFTVARDLLRRLTAGQLSISSREADEARAALVAGREHERQLADDVESLRTALTAKIRRLEGRLDDARWVLRAGWLHCVL